MNGKSEVEDEESKSKNSKKVICWECGEKVYKWPECKKLKKKKEEEDEEESESAFLITNDAQEDLSLATMETSSLDDGWYVDSGATKHMSNRKEWFEKLKAVDISSRIT